MEGTRKERSGRESWRKDTIQLSWNCHKWTNWRTCRYPSAGLRVGRQAHADVSKAFASVKLLLLWVCGQASLTDLGPLLVRKIWTWSRKEWEQAWAQWMDSFLCALHHIWPQRLSERNKCCFTSVCLFCRSNLTPYKEKTSGKCNSNLTKVTVQITT